jgi:hypothetical protein
VEDVAKALCWAWPQKYSTEEWWQAHHDAEGHRIEARRILGLDPKP